MPQVKWVPAYYSADHGEKGDRDRGRGVVDATGAGNGFMGAVSAALDEGKDLPEGESERATAL
jgi:sugar/nucleoside kinase (ribokinase family)